MKTEEIKEIIDRYFDDELTKQEEVFLFTRLSQNETAREYFKKQNILKTAIQSTMEEFPEHLEERIFNSLPKQKKGAEKFHYFHYIPAAVSAIIAIILLAITFNLYNKTENYKEQLEITIRRVNRQQQTIQLLFNSLPATEIKGYLKNQITVTPKM